MKLKKYMTELAMKSNTKLDVKSQKGRHFNAKISLKNGTQWFFSAENEMGEGDWNIAFWESDIYSSSSIPDKHKVGLQLFAAVEKLTKDFLKSEKPERFRFSATGVSRIKLYETLAKKILKDGTYEKGPSMRMLQGNNWSFVRK